MGATLVEIKFVGHTRRDHCQRLLDSGSIPDGSMWGTGLDHPGGAQTRSCVRDLIVDC